MFFLVVHNMTWQMIAIDASISAVAPSETSPPRREPAKKSAGHRGGRGGEKNKAIKEEKPDDGEECEDSIPFLT